MKGVTRVARTESDREDLMREATALRRRAELRVLCLEELVTAGFRSTGELSLYFGQDPAWHFDTGGRLRRAFADGSIYRSQGITLARLDRARTPAETVLVRHDLSRAELEAFIAAMRSRVERLRASVAAGDAELVRVVGEPAAFRDELIAALDRVLNCPEPLSPPVGVR